MGGHKTEDMVAGQELRTGEKTREEVRERPQFLNVHEEF